MARDLPATGATNEGEHAGHVLLHGRLSDRAIYNGSAGAEIQELFARGTWLSESPIVLGMGVSGRLIMYVNRACKT